MSEKSRRKTSKNKKTEQKPTERIASSVIQQIARDLESYSQTISQDNKRKTKDKFMDLYQKCEYAYKHVLIDYKIIVDGYESVPGYKPPKGKNEKKFNPDNLRIIDSQVENVMLYAGIIVDSRLFCNDMDHNAAEKKSCRVLRNEITHRSSKKAVEEVFTRHKELFSVMNSFLKHFKVKQEKDGTQSKVSK